MRPEIVVSIQKCYGKIIFLDFILMITGAFVLVCLVRFAIQFKRYNVCLGPRNFCLCCGKLCHQHNVFTITFSTSLRYEMVESARCSNDYTISS